MKTKKRDKKSDEILIEIRCETLGRPLILTQKEFQDRITNVLCTGMRRIYNEDAKRILNSLIK